MAYRLEAAPVVMVKNEEIWIQRVLRPLVAVFGLALVGDTGSTDDTVALARAVNGVDVTEFGPMDPSALGQVRRELGRLALVKGLPWIMMVDGDELYHEDALRLIAGYEPPEGKSLGYTTMLTLDLDAEGNYWELADKFSRTAVMPSDTAWKGQYPFEVPVLFDRPQTFFYYPNVEGMGYHAVHLHRLVRSRHDDGVMFRQQKQYRFSMQDVRIPRVGRFEPAGWW